MGKLERVLFKSFECREWVPSHTWSLLVSARIYAASVQPTFFRCSCIELKSLQLTILLTNHYQENILQSVAFCVIGWGTDFGYSMYMTFWSCQPPQNHAHRTAKRNSEMFPRPHTAHQHCQVACASGKI